MLYHLLTPSRAAGIDPIVPLPHAFSWAHSRSSGGLCNRGPRWRRDLRRGFVRQSLLRALRHLHRLALRAGHLERFLVFGSFVTDKETPGDLDVYW